MLFCIIARLGFGNKNNYFLHSKRKILLKNPSVINTSISIVLSMRYKYLVILADESSTILMSALIDFQHISLENEFDLRLPGESICQIHLDQAEVLEEDAAML